MFKCIFCGNDNPIILQHHHIIPKELSNLNLEKFGFDLSEYGKTVVLCANCHRVIHDVLRPFIKYMKILGEENEEIIQGISNPKHDMLEQKIMQYLSNGELIEAEVLYGSFFEYGESICKVKQIIYNLFRNGKIYSPKTGFYRIVS